MTRLNIKRKKHLFITLNSVLLALVRCARKLNYRDKVVIVHPQDKRLQSGIIKNDDSLD